MTIGLAFACFLAIATVVGCSRDEPAAPSQPVPVRVAELAPAANPGGLRYSATVTPQTQLDLAERGFQNIHALVDN